MNSKKPPKPPIASKNQKKAINENLPNKFYLSDVNNTSIELELTPDPLPMQVYDLNCKAELKI